MADGRAGHPLDHAQRQVVILGTGETGATAAGLPHPFGAIRDDAAEVTLRQQQVGVPIGLELRIGSAPLVIDVVLVAVDDIGIRVGVDLLGEQVERMGGEPAVAPEPDHELAGRLRQGVIRGRAQVLSPEQVAPDPSVAGCIAVQALRHRSRTDQVKLPPVIDLRAHRIDRRLRPRRLRRHGQDDAEQGAPLERIDPPPDRRKVGPGERVMRADPIRIVLVRTTDAQPGAPEDIRHPLVAPQPEHAQEPGIPRPTLACARSAGSRAVSCPFVPHHIRSVLLSLPILTIGIHGRH